MDLAELAVIGTVSDVAPVLGENRAIARLGLERMRTAPRPGIAALLERARASAAGVDLETVGFVLAPRLNAAGRVGEALDAARLLLAETAEEAAELAATLETANATRRDLMRTAIAEARTALGLPEPGAAPGQELLFPETRPDAPPVLVAGGPDAPALLAVGPWPVGIIGLVAGRLADETGRPAIVGTRIGDVIRASCRSDGRVNLATALEACGDLFIRFGGHAAAAGFELPVERWDAFAARFLELAASAMPTDALRPLAVDLALPAGYVDYALFRDLARLAPCGHGNPDPLVAVLGLTVQRVRAASGGHTQLVLRRDRDVVDGIAFGRADLATALVEGDRVDVVARLASRVFGGLETLQLEVRDVAAVGLAPAGPRGAGSRRRAGRRAGRPRRRRARRPGSRMTRSPRVDRPRAVRPPGRKDPYGLLPAGTPIAAILSAVGLVAIAIVSIALFQGQLPIGGGGGQGNGNGQPGATDDPRVIKTPTPSGVVVVPSEPPELEIPGTFVYAKDGNVWLQADGAARQLTDNGNDSMPSFNEDGTAVYFVRTRPSDGAWSVDGVIRDYEHGRARR